MHWGKQVTRPTYSLLKRMATAAPLEPARSTPMLDGRRPP